MQLMIKKMKDKFDKYWSECNLLISMAAVLDPRNKMQLIEWCFPLIYSRGDSIEHVVTVRETLHMLYREYLEAHKTNNEKESQGESEKEAVNSSVSSGKGKTRGRAEFYNYIRNVESVVEQAKSKMDVYLDEGVHISEDDSKFNVLEWRKMFYLKFRVLSKMACAILSIPIITVTSESTFSAGGRVIDPYRATLDAKIIQVLLCGED